MTKPTNEELLKVITAAAKETLEETKYHNMMFFIEDANGKLQIVVVPEVTDDNKSAIISKLGSTIEEIGSERYLMVSECFGVNETKVNEQIKEVQETIVNGNLSLKKLHEAVTLLKELKNRPCDHPSRRDLLMVSLYDKHKGTYSYVYPFEIKNENIVWHEDAFNSEGLQSAYSRFNVWHPYQINLDENEE